MVMLIAGGSLSVGSHDPHFGTSMPLGAVHPIWAVVSAVEGQEPNRVYRRTDNGSVPGHASLELAREVMVEPGRGIALMPQDIHSIHTFGTAPTRHLHVYGLALEKLDERQGFDLEQGTVQPYNKAFMKPTANR